MDDSTHRAVEDAARDMDRMAERMEGQSEQLEDHIAASRQDLDELRRTGAAGDADAGTDADAG